jgi:hypothetical protein
MTNTATYMSGRNKYGRPQAMLFSENPGIIQNGFHIPEGNEFEDFIILSDHNRQQIQFKPNRIETKLRTVNGRMRSYHIADKLSISTSWDNLPSRAASAALTIDEESGQTLIGANDLAYTADNGAGGVDLLNWYEGHKGSFWVFLAYDKFTNFNSDSYNKLSQYNEVIEVFFDDFQYDVVNRGRGTHDFWNISLSLEEV